MSIDINQLIDIDWFLAIDDQSIITSQETPDLSIAQLFLN